MSTVTVRYFAGARAAAGTVTESAAAGSVSALRQDLCTRHGATFARVLGASTLLCDGRPLAEDAVVPAGATVEVLPPFAGG